MFHRDLEESSREQFNKWAPKYDGGIWSRYFRSGYRKAVKESGDLENAEIIDIGCGTGGLYWFMTENHTKISHYSGVDLSPEMIKYAKRKMAEDVYNASFYLGSSENLVFEQSAFDVAFCLNAFHHFPRQDISINEMGRVLRRGGHLVLLDLFSNNVLRKVWIGVVNFLFKEKGVKYHTKQSIKELLEKKDFRVISQKSFLFFTLFTVAEKR